MAESDSVDIGSRPTLEDVMAALAHKSIFDLPTLAKKLVSEAQAKTEGENDPKSFDIIVHEHYVMMHDDNIEAVKEQTTLEK